MKKYGNAPIELDSLMIRTDEMYLYQYLPIKLIGKNEIRIPEQISRYFQMVWKCVDDFRGIGRDLDEYYIYLTAKCMYMGSGTTINRSGWHSDGFGTNDINYIWSDVVPTQYITGDFIDVPKDDSESLTYFEEKGTEAMLKGELHICDPNTIYKLDDTVIHSCSSYIGQPILRHFVKLSFSKDKYDLKGNSHNYLLDYKWEMRDRSRQRNIPQSLS